MNLASLAAVAAGLCVSDHPEAWRVLLDALRKRGFKEGCGFDPTTTIKCTERESDLMVKEKKTLAQVRGPGSGYKAGDEDKDLYLWTDTGQLRRIRASEHRWLENGSVKRLFEVTARFLGELIADSVLKALTEEVVGDATPTVERAKLRGRKRKFTPEQIANAVRMKAEGKSNNEAAKMLYGPTPTAGQRRSVPTILKHRSKKTLEK
jgi:hypothetical protein